MVKQMKFVMFIFLAIFLTSCASTPDMPAPAWVTNVQSVFPWERYITGRGDGSTRQDAEARALAEIALYFVRETTVERTQRAAWTERDGLVSAEAITEENILVESHTQLVAVRFAEDPWFNRATRAWETVGFIQREEAWSVYEPTARRQADAFLALVRAAENETEPFNTVLRFGAADAYARSAEFNAVRNFAQVLHPRQANLLFGETDTALAGLLQRQLIARERAVISIQSPVDHDRIIYQAMVTALGNAGFVTESGRNTGTVAIVRVEEGRQAHGSGIIYHPSLTVTISGSTGAMMSFRVTGERVGAINPDIARRRAYVSLATALEGAFARELQRWQSSLVRN